MVVCVLLHPQWAHITGRCVVGVGWWVVGVVCWVEGGWWWVDVGG